MKYASGQSLPDAKVSKSAAAINQHNRLNFVVEKTVLIVLLEHALKQLYFY